MRSIHSASRISLGLGCLEVHHSRLLVQRDHAEVTLEGTLLLLLTSLALHHGEVFDDALEVEAALQWLRVHLNKITDILQERVRIKSDLERNICIVCLFV